MCSHWEEEVVRLYAAHMMMRWWCCGEFGVSVGEGERKKSEEEREGGREGGRRREDWRPATARAMEKIVMI